MFAERRRRADAALVGALAVLFLLFVCAVGAPILAPHDPLVQNAARRLVPPFSPGHLLGTDDLGRDQLSRIIYGTRTALVVGAGSAAAALALGVVCGTAAGLLSHGRWAVVDHTLAVVMDGILSFPTVLLALAATVVLGTGTWQVALTLAVVFTPVVFRVVRVETRRAVRTDYLRAAWLMGTPAWMRVVMHVLPGAMPRALVQAATLAAVAVGVEAALSYLGLGTQPPAPSWGLMLKDARRYLPVAPYLSIVPGLATGAAAFSFQLLADRLAARWAVGRSAE